MERGLLTAAAALTLVAAACAGDGRSLGDPVSEMSDRPETVSTLPESTLSPSTVASTAASSVPPVRTGIVFDRLFSPANATAQIDGSGAVSTDPVTVDDQPADILSFDREPDGRFVARIWIDTEGAHTVCVADTCGRVYTLAPDAESPEEVETKVDRALIEVARYLDVEAEFPEWSVEMGTPLSGTGGSVDVDTRTVTIHRNRGRTLDDYVRTVLHEFGHAADIDRLTDDERAAYLQLRGLDPSRRWRDQDGHRLDDWARQPSEDFAEAMVMIWSGGRWTPRTDGIGPVPDDGQLAAIAALVAADDGG